MKKRILFALLASIGFFNKAQCVYIDGFDYRLDEKTGNAVALGASWQDSELLQAETLYIPAFVTYNNKNYYVTEIDYEAFAYWDEVKYVSLPNTIMTIGEGAFKNCVNLRYVFHDNHVLTTIKASAFAGCKSLGAIILPPTLANLGARAFERCTSLGSIDFCGTLLVDIPYAVCRGCTKLRVINMLTGAIPGITGIRRIQANAFEGCGMSWIGLPSSLLSIGTEAFKGCKELKVVTCYFDDPFVISTDVFDDYDHTTLEVLKGRMGEFQNVSSWNLFCNVKEVDVTSVASRLADSVDPTEVTTYFDTQGRAHSHPVKGLNIVRSKDGTVKKILIK